VVVFRERERSCACGGGVQRERERSRVVVVFRETSPQAEPPLPPTPPA
jgi:hypothetical protein